MRINLKTLNRTCGECTLCCKLLGVTELQKVPNKYCDHAKKSKGCEIYDTRPETCRQFNCLWLKGLFDDSHQPHKIHGVAGPSSDGQHLIIWEDPGYPGVATSKLQSVINKVVIDGTKIVIVVCGNKRSFFGNPAIAEAIINNWKENGQDQTANLP